MESEVINDTNRRVSKIMPKLHWSTKHIEEVVAPNMDAHTSFSPNENSSRTIVRSMLHSDVEHLLYPDGNNKSVKQNQGVQQRCLKVYICSVVPQQEEHLLKFFHPPTTTTDNGGAHDAHAPCCVIRLARDNFIDQVPWDTLGIDRLCGLAGANFSAEYADHLQNDLLLLDGGTCNTYLAKVDGKIIGGGILPGLKQKIEAMKQYAPCLPHVSWSSLQDFLVANEYVAPTFGFNTPDNLSVGILGEFQRNFVALVKDFLNLVASSDRATVVVTGGDGEMLFAMLTGHSIRDAISGHGNFYLSVSCLKLDPNVVVIYNKHLVEHGIVDAIQNTLERRAEEQCYDDDGDFSPRLAEGESAQHSSDMQLNEVVARVVQNVTHVDDLDDQDEPTVVTGQARGFDKEQEASAAVNEARTHNSQEYEEIETEEKDYLERRVANCFDGYLHYGTINGTKMIKNNLHYKVTYDDGDQEDYTRKEIMKLFEMYDEDEDPLDGSLLQRSVACYFDDVLYLGEVRKLELIDDEWNYLVVYEDGDKQHYTKKDTQQMIRLYASKTGHDDDSRKRRTPSDNVDQKEYDDEEYEFTECVGPDLVSERVAKQVDSKIIYGTIKEAEEHNGKMTYRVEFDDGRSHSYTQKRVEGVLKCYKKITEKQFDSMKPSERKQHLGNNLRNIKPRTFIRKQAKRRKTGSSEKKCTNPNPISTTFKSSLHEERPKSYKNRGRINKKNNARKSEMKSSPSRAKSDDSTKSAGAIPNVSSKLAAKNATDRRKGRKRSLLETKNGADVAGMRVAKNFNGSTFFGTITKYLPSNGDCDDDVDIWQIDYDDNDREEYDPNDLKTALRLLVSCDFAF